MITIKPAVKKKFDAVEMMRSIREKISRQTANLTIAEELEFYRNKASEFRKNAGQ